VCGVGAAYAGSGSRPAVKDPAKFFRAVGQSGRGVGVHDAPGDTPEQVGDAGRADRSGDPDEPLRDWLGVSDKRQIWGLISDVLDVLEQHGYHRAGNQHTGRAVGLIGDLARIYEGTQKAPAGAYVIQMPASPQAAEPADPGSDRGAGLGAAQMTTILAARDEAADHKRDLAANCAYCPDQSCPTCQFWLGGPRRTTR